MTPRAHELGQHVGGVAEQRDRPRRASRAATRATVVERVVQRRRSPRPRSASAGAARCGAGPLRRPAPTPPFIVAASGWAPPMPPRPAETNTRPARLPPNCRLASRRERLVGALQDALRADVDPAAGRHLAVHRQALVLEIAEVLPRGPRGHEQGVGDEHARRARVRAEDADRLARLHEQRLVVLERAQRARRWRRSTPSCAPPCPSRRRRSGRPAARRRRDRGCSSACAARLPAASPCRRSRCRAGRESGG